MSYLRVDLLDAWPDPSKRPACRVHHAASCERLAGASSYCLQFVTFSFGYGVMNYDLPSFATFEYGVWRRKGQHSLEESKGI